MGRRQFGSIRKLSSGRWQGSYWHEGVRHVADDTFRTKADANAWLGNVVNDIRRGDWTDPAAGRRLFGDYAKVWLDTRLTKQGAPLRPSTRQGYDGLMRRNLLPHFEGRQLRQLTVSVVRAWHAEVTKSAGADQAAKSYRLLRAILNTAAADGLITTNPCRVDGAGVEHADERPLVPLAVVFRLADAIADRFRAIVILAAFGGLRPGEMLGLTRGDIDLKAREVRVRVGAHEIIGKGRVVTEPKTEAGKRPVSLPVVAVEALEAHLERFAQPGPDGVVFTGVQGNPLRRSRLSDAWRAAVEAVPEAPAGLRLYDLRHTAATFTARMPGITTKELMARIGHASAERDRQVAAWLDEQATLARDTKDDSGSREDRAREGDGSAKK